MKKLLVLFILAFSAVACFAVELGDDFLTISLTDLNRQRYRSKDIFDGSWIILDFFATDCEPCMKELPEINEFVKKMMDEGKIKIKGYIIATDEGSADMLKDFFKNFETVMTVLHDRYKKMAERYGVTKLPSLFLVNPQGKIALIQIGYSETLVKDLKKIILK